MAPGRSPRWRQDSDCRRPPRRSRRCFRWIYRGVCGARSPWSPIRFDAVVGYVLDEPTARFWSDVDFLVLASDTMQSRRVSHAIVHQYLVPSAQVVRAKVAVDPRTRQVGDVFVATRPVLPSPGHGCQMCHQLISPARLNEDFLSPGEWQRRLSKRAERAAAGIGPFPLCRKAGAGSGLPRLVAMPLSPRRWPRPLSRRSCNCWYRRRGSGGRCLTHSGPIATLPAWPKRRASAVAGRRSLGKSR